MYTSISVMKLLRYGVGYVFIVSGLMKLLSTDLSGYFMSLGIPYPREVMYVVAITEVLCGGLIVLDKWVKRASIPLLIIMVGAILLTKVPTLHTGILQFAFDARLDVVMIILLFILYNRHAK
ncbi:DoxX family protein [Bacillus carboniphilus]|uniref:DoxX family protein n=1 Tax=Bacillus carboniphilus TaxID=86663 RepID=A0ABN0WMB7_9BACI